MSQPPSITIELASVLIGYPHLYKYVEFTVEIRRGHEVRHGARVTVEYVKPDMGRAAATDARPSTASISRLIPAMTAEQRARLGEELGHCMFPPSVLGAFHELLGTLGPGTGVRIRLRCIDAEMSRWPWELTRIKTPGREEPRYLFRDERFSLARDRPSPHPVHPPKERPKLVILNIDATKVLKDQVLVGDFPAELPGTGTVRRYDLPHPTPKSIDEVIDQIADSLDPLDIFHFTGHGRPPHDDQPGTLVVYRDDDSGAQHYRGDTLAKQLDRAGTSLAFVNACYGDAQLVSGEQLGIAQSLTGVVPVVVVMRGVVGDRVAKDFAGEFYRWLLAGGTVDEAVARGRLLLDESGGDWGQVVLYSRASSGRFLEPAAPAAGAGQAELQVPANRPAPDGIRRWALVAGVRGHWQLVPGQSGPELRQVDSGTTADITHLRTVDASLALSCDARVVAQVNQGQLALAWVDRVQPRLDHWPRSFELTLDGQAANLLAVAVDYGSEVVCLLSTDRATYRVDVSPHTEPIVHVIFDSPTRCATILAGRMYTVDKDGHLREGELNLRIHGIAEVCSLDAARSGGRVVYAIAGLGDDRRPVVAENYSGTLAALPGVSADEVVVVRQWSGAYAPNQVLLATGGHIERAARGGES